jgi:hypothetical protein
MTLALTCRKTLRLATVGIMALGVSSTSQLRAQSSATQTHSPAFEVASGKQNTSGENRIMIGIQPGGGFRAIGAPLRELIGMAYGTSQPLSSFIAGGPKWIDSEVPSRRAIS